MPNEKFNPLDDEDPVFEPEPEPEVTEAKADAPARRLGTGAAGCPEHPKLTASELKDHECEAY